MVLQLFAQCCWGNCNDQLYSPVRFRSDKLEDNARGKLNINSNSPLDCRGDGNNILVGAPKPTRQFNLTTSQQYVSKIITSEASPKKVPSSHHVWIDHVSDICKMSGAFSRATERRSDVTARTALQAIWKLDIHSLYSENILQQKRNTKIFLYVFTQVLLEWKTQR